MNGPNLIRFVHAFFLVLLFSALPTIAQNATKHPGMTKVCPLTFAPIWYQGNDA
jgi:hypothetical protein